LKLSTLGIAGIIKGTNIVLDSTEQSPFGLELNIAANSTIGEEGEAAE
jgi:hypothetical protein